MKIYSTEFGSKLYGTSTPTSDTDIKHIVLPPLDDLLILKRIENKVKKTNDVKNVRNSVDDIDEEMIPLQIFARHFLNGQTYAIEIAFSILGNHAGQTINDPRGTVYERDNTHYVTISNDSLMGGYQSHAYFVDFVKELKEKFLTSNIKAMMGYVVNQANMYSFKGERLNVTRELIDIFSKVPLPDTQICVGDIYLQNQLFFKSTNDLALKYPKYFKITTYNRDGSGDQAPCFTILEKTIPFTDKVDYAYRVLKTIENKYGSRAERASESNVDWKATMHALRIVDEGIAILQDHKIDFPFHENYVEYLLKIKNGQIPLEQVKDEISEKLELLKDLEKNTTLPQYTVELNLKFEEWLASWMYRFYGIEYHE